MFPSLNSYSNFISQDHCSTVSPEISRVHADTLGTLNSAPIGNPISPMNPSHHQQQQPQKPKKKRNLPGNPDPDAEVIALSPRTLLATNRFVCEICNKGFQRDQNLQLHRRGHNLPWKLKQRSSRERRKKAYVCPEATCLHHHPSRALGDLTGIKKHFCRKHGEKKWKCEKCSKVYAVQSDWKAHAKTCGTREYRCDCGTLFSRKDSFITHRAFCDALAEESARLSAATNNSISPQNPNKTISTDPTLFHHFNSQTLPPTTTPPLLPRPSHHRLHYPPPPYQNPYPIDIKTEHTLHNTNYLDSINPLLPYQDRTLLVAPTGGGPPPLSATALLQRAAAAAAGGTHARHVGSAMANLLDMHHVAPPGGDDGFTRDFLGLAGGGRAEVKFPPVDFERDRGGNEEVMRNGDKGYGFDVETSLSWDRYW